MLQTFKENLREINDDIPGGISDGITEESPKRIVKGISGENPGSVLEEFLTQPRK